MEGHGEGKEGMLVKMLKAGVALVADCTALVRRNTTPSVQI